MTDQMKKLSEKLDAPIVNKEVTISSNETKKLDVVKEAVKNKEIEVLGIKIRYQTGVLGKLDLFLLRNYNLINESKTIKGEPKIVRSLRDFTNLLKHTNNWVRKNLFNKAIDKESFENVKLKLRLTEGDENFNYDEMDPSSVKHFSEFEIIKEIAGFVNKINGFETDYIGYKTQKDDSIEFIKKLDKVTVSWHPLLITPKFENGYFKIDTHSSNAESVDKYLSKLFNFDVLKEHEVDKFYKNPIVYKKSVKKFIDNYEKGRKYMQEADKLFNEINSYMNKMGDKYKEYISFIDKATPDKHYADFLINKYRYITASIFRSLTDIITYLKDVFIHNTKVSMELYTELSKEEFKLLLK